MDNNPLKIILQIISIIWTIVFAYCFFFNTKFLDDYFFYFFIFAIIFTAIGFTFRYKSFKKVNDKVLLETPKIKLLKGEKVELFLDGVEYLVTSRTSFHMKNKPMKLIVTNKRIIYPYNWFGFDYHGLFMFL